MTEKKATGWSREKVVEELRGLSMQLGRTPTEKDAGACVSGAAIAHFGSWNEAKRAAGLETCFRGRFKGTVEKTPEAIRVYLRAIAEGLRRLDEAIEEMTKLRKDTRDTTFRPDSARPSPLYNIRRDLNWLKIRLGLLMIHLPELAEREGFALGTKPPQENARRLPTARN